MIENKDDTQVIDYVFNLISRQDWVDEEILMTYETCYRLARKLYIEMGEDTGLLDKTRNEIMKLYGQI